jgi:hypothetical protein
MRPLDQSAVFLAAYILMVSGSRKSISGFDRLIGHRAVAKVACLVSDPESLYLHRITASSTNIPQNDGLIQRTAISRSLESKTSGR